MPISLRDYQVETILANNRAFEMGYKAPLNVLFTGAGKTEIFIEYVMRSVNLNTERVLINCPAHLTVQTYMRFLSRYPELERKITIDFTQPVDAIGVVLGDTSNDSARCICGSVPTLIDRDTENVMGEIQREDFVVNRFGGIELSPTSQRAYLVSYRFDRVLKWGLFKYILNDEAHHSVAPSSLAIFRALDRIDTLLGREPTRKLGFTATAYREDGLGLDNLYDCIAIQKPANWGIQNGFLVPVLPPINIGSTVGGRAVSISELENSHEIIIKAWQERAENRLTLGYFNSVEDSIAATQAMNEAGIAAAHLDGSICIDTDNQRYNLDRRTLIFEKFLRGEIRVLNNFGVLIEGKDLPPASCMIWARNTENSVLFTQALGRILRLFDGNEFHPRKENALVLNATDNDLIMLTMGSLLGLQADMSDFVVETLTEDAELEVELPEIDIKDIRDEKLIGEDVTYTIGRIIKHSGSDWYHGEDDVLTLKISLEDTLVIVPPHYILAKRYELLRDALYERFATMSASPDYMTLLEQVAKMEELFGNYTLWHVKGKKVQDETFVYADQSLALVMDFSIPYAHSKSEGVLKSFVARKRTGWKKKEEPITPDQSRMLSQLDGGKADLSLSKLEAFQRIGYLMAFNRAVRSQIAAMYTSCETLLKKSN